MATTESRTSESTGIRTSVWLSWEDHDAWKASGVSLAALVRRGLEAPAPAPLEDTAARLEKAVTALEALIAP